MGFSLTSVCEDAPETVYPGAKYRAGEFFSRTRGSRRDFAPEPRNIALGRCDFSQKRAVGITYYGYRYYDPVTGRWPGRDPIGENYRTAEFNEYAFIKNWVIGGYDYLGLTYGSGLGSGLHNPTGHNPATGATIENPHVDERDSPVAPLAEVILEIAIPLSAIEAASQGRFLAVAGEVALGKLKVVKKFGKVCCGGVKWVKLKFTKKLSKNDAQKLADELQNLPGSQRPNTVAVINHGNGTVTSGVNQGGVVNAQVTEALKKAPKNSFGGECAEINAIAAALNEGKLLQGSKITVSDIRGVNSISGKHGANKKPCKTCKFVLKFFEVKVKKR